MNWLNKAKANIADMTSNPADYTQMVIDRLRNRNERVQPTIAGGELTNRPLTEEEAMQQDMDLAMNVGPGAINAGPARALMKKIVDKEYDPGVYAKILRGEHPEKVLRELDDIEAFYTMPGNKAYRYETERPLFDKGVVHYDAAGGLQLMDIIKNSRVGPKGGIIKPAQWEKNIANSQIREADISAIPEEAAIYTPYDRWIGEYASKKRPELPKGKYEFYQNELEGFPNPYPEDMPTPKIRDILNDPDLRKEYNLSLAAPADSPFHLLAKILREK